MTWYQILTLCGVTTLSSLIVSFIFNSIVNGSSAKKKYLEAEAQAREHDLNVLKVGVQALLRNNLYSIYQEWIPQRWAPMTVRENFENLYKSYHNLGSNGVMDHYYEEFMDLPIVKPVRHYQKQRTATTQILTEAKTVAAKE